ncbi:putative hydrolase [Helianthus anomalus]
MLLDSMLRYQLPEILRTPLQELCLQIKSLQLGAVGSFLRPLGEKVKTNSVYIRDSTSISDYALLMFGGNLIPSKNGDGIEMLDVYLQFSASKSVLGLIKVRFCVRYGDMGGMSNG